jgi:hypothetical protein
MRQFRLLALLGLVAVAAAALARNLPRLAPGMFDWAEPGNVAAALVQGRGFSDPFDGGTGATAWVSPLPVCVEAAVFATFGVKTAASASALLALSAVGLALANVLLLSALGPYGNWARGAASAAFLCYCAFVPGGPLAVLSEAWLDVLLSAALLWAALETGRSSGEKGGAALVCVAALAPLDNAGLALSTGIVLLALAWRFRGDARRLMLPVAAAVACAVSVGAWTARNEAALGRFVPLKSNFWFELHLANVDSSDGLPRMETVLRRLPFFDVREFDRYALLGEVRYVETFRRPALASIRSAPLHFAANVARRAADAVVFCRREGGGEFTKLRTADADRMKLVASGEFISLGPEGGGFWTRIDTPPAEERARLHSLGLSDEAGVWRDWAEKRRGFDDQFRGPAGLATGFLTAGIPVAALLLAALLRGGRLIAPAALAAAIAFGMLLPFILVNHNERHQLPLIAMQAVAIGAYAQALADRRDPATGAP